MQTFKYKLEACKKLLQRCKNKLLACKYKNYKLVKLNGMLENTQIGLALIL